jgi:hypothetical protein
MQHFSKNTEGTLKVKAPEEWHEIVSILRKRKYKLSFIDRCKITNKCIEEVVGFINAF